MDVRSLVCEPRRRYLLSLLLERRELAFDTVTMSLATREAIGDERSDFDTVRERVALSLVHNHLPRLADHDLLEYDRRSGDIVTTEVFDELRPTIERFVRADREDVPLPVSLSSVRLDRRRRDER